MLQRNKTAASFFEAGFGFKAGSAPGIVGPYCPHNPLKSLFRDLALWHADLVSRLQFAQRIYDAAQHRQRIHRTIVLAFLEICAALGHGVCHVSEAENLTTRR